MGSVIWVPNRSLLPYRMGQAIAPQVTPAVAPASQPRVVTVSRQEAEMMVRVVEEVIRFAKEFPLEFHAFCPMERWEETLRKVGSGIADIESQLSTGREPIMVSADTVFSMVDLEECTSGARTERLFSARTALIISGGAAVAEFLFGLKWLAIPAYVVSLALVLGRPLFERAKEVPSEPFRPDTMAGLHGPCRLGDHTDKAKVIERVIVAPGPKVQRHHWGWVRPGQRTPYAGTCLVQKEFRVRVEGWSDDQVSIVEGWKRAPMSECTTARNEIAVWEPCMLPPRESGFPAVPEESGHEETFWVEYAGPLTDGVMRRAGPFG